MLKKKIIQVGTSWGVIIPKTLLEMTNINPVIDEIEMYLENNEIRIRKITDKKS